jgi:hypothetical protein
VGRIKGGHGATGTMAEVSAGRSRVWGGLSGLEWCGDGLSGLEWRVDGIGWDGIVEGCR